MIIEAHELTVGNKIRRKSTGAICTVNWGIIKDAEDGNVSDYEPIFIYPKLLTDNGFESNGFNSYNIKGFIITYENGKYIWDWKKQTGAIGSIFTSFLFVHELQNLYLFTTGKKWILNNITC